MAWTETPTFRCLHVSLQIDTLAVLIIKKDLPEHRWLLTPETPKDNQDIWMCLADGMHDLKEIHGLRGSNWRLDKIPTLTTLKRSQ